MIDAYFIIEEAPVIIEEIIEIKPPSPNQQQSHRPITFTAPTEPPMVTTTSVTTTSHEQDNALKATKLKPTV